MSQALYRKYRPQKFSEIIGQAHIVQTLSNAIIHNHIGHAYLFTGPRGTGKTTLARIFAKAINCANLSSEKRAADKSSIRRSPAEADNQNSNYYEPCLICENCKTIQNGRSLDITEIDAASHTGVDNIRELKETVKLPPTSAKYKVYIIDEVHMLSTGAFNALLKTLEEPPAHAIFILATTEIHKVPETIISRCQRFDFVRLPMESIIKKLSVIAAKESVKIGAGALETIAIAAEGGMRDAESILAQIISLEDKNITEKEVEEILGTSDRQSIEEMARLILAKDAAAAITLLGKIADGGYDIDVFAKALLNYFRQLMLLVINPAVSQKLTYELSPKKIATLQKLAEKAELAEIIKILDYLSESRNKIKASFIPQLPLELAILKAINNPPSTPANPPQIKNTPSETKKIIPAPLPENKPTIINAEESTPTKEATTTPLEIETDPANDTATAFDMETVRDNWQKFLEAIKPHNHSLSAILQNCQPIKAEGNRITIAAKYGIHKDKLNEPQSRLTIGDVFGKILNSKVTTQVLTEEEAGIKIHPTKSTFSSAPIQETASQTNSLLTDALNIFGGKIVNE